MYKLFFKLFQNNGYKSKWITMIKTIFDDVGLSFIWLDQETLACDLMDFRNLVFSKLDDVYIQEWNAELSENSQCGLYKSLEQLIVLKNIWWC